MAASKSSAGGSAAKPTVTHPDGTSETARVPHLRIFPHVSSEFASSDQLTTWLMTNLRAWAGEYYLRSEKAVADLPRGSIVLFRKDDLLVGEAMVDKYQRGLNLWGTTVDGEKVRYRASVRFCSTSIRIFSPPIEVKAMQQVVNRDISVARSYFKFEDWSIYPQLLAVHIKKGGTFL